MCAEVAVFAVVVVLVLWLVVLVYLFIEGELLFDEVYSHLWMWIAGVVVDFYDCEV